MAAVKLADIVAALGGELHGDPQIHVERIAALDSADAGAISFLANARYAGRLAESRAACVIVAPAQRDAALARGAAGVTDAPLTYHARPTQWRGGALASE